VIDPLGQTTAATTPALKLPLVITKEVRSYRVPGERVTAMALSLQGKQFLTGGSDRIVRWWDVDSGDQLGQLDMNGRWVLALAFSSDGAKALCGGEGVYCVCGI